MRKNDERYPRPERGLDEKGSQDFVFFLSQTRVAMLEDLFSDHIYGSHNKIIKRDKVGVADLKTFLSEVLQVNIIHEINFDNDCQIEEARRFLEKCRDIVSLTCELTDFLENLSHFKGETLRVTREKHYEAAKRLGDLFELREQARKMSSQVKSLKLKTGNVEDFREELEKQASTQSFPDEFGNPSKEVTFEDELLFYYFNVILERYADGNNVLAEIAQQYWDYFPEELQHYLAADMTCQIKAKNYLSDAISPFETAPKNIRQYLASVVHAEDAIKKAKESQGLAPTVRLSELDKRCLPSSRKKDKSGVKGDSDTLTTPPNKGYTLEELLGKVTPENSHEATDWGKPFGSEVW